MRVGSTLLLKNKKCYQSYNWSYFRPLGSLQIAVDSLDEYECDEVAIIRPVRDCDSLDLFSRDLDVLRELNAMTPISFGGGIRSREHLELLEGLPVERFVFSSAFIANIDEAKNHYDVRSIYTSEMGRALSNTVDQNLLQLAVLGAQASATVTGGSGGTQITDADANTNATSLISSIFECAEALDEKDVPSEDRFCVVTPNVYYQIVQNDKILNRDFGANGNGVYSDGTVIKVAGINIVKSNTAVDAYADNSASVSGTNNTYNVDASNVVATVFHKSAIGTVKLMDLGMESEYDLRRQGTLMVGKMALGSGIIRPESATLIKTA